MVSDTEPAFLIPVKGEPQWNAITWTPRSFWQGPGSQSTCVYSFPLCSLSWFLPPASMSMLDNNGAIRDANPPPPPHHSGSAEHRSELSTLLRAAVGSDGPHPALLMKTLRPMDRITGGRDRILTQRVSLRKPCPTPTSCLLGWAPQGPLGDPLSPNSASCIGHHVAG